MLMPLSKVLKADKEAFYSVSSFFLFNISKEVLHSQRLIYIVGIHISAEHTATTKTNLPEKSPKYSFS